MSAAKEKAPAGGPRLKVKQISRTHSTALAAGINADSALRGAA